MVVQSFLLNTKASTLFSTTRDLEAETRTTLDTLLQHSSILGEEDEFNDEYLLDDPQDCLELLEQLQAEEENVIVAWPEGEVTTYCITFRYE